jgi:hypothetical protein
MVFNNPFETPYKLVCQRSACLNRLKADERLSTLDKEEGEAVSTPVWHGGAKF